MATTEMTLGKALLGILRNRCPSCGQGKVFAGIYKMNPTCPSCGVKFEREQGYFLGAMVFSYTFGAFLMVPTAVILAFGTHVDVLWVIVIPCIQAVVLNPVFFKYSRLAWLYLDQRYDPT